MPPYIYWQPNPAVGRIPPHRTDTGAYLVSEVFGARSMIYVKDEDGLYTADPKKDRGATFIPQITVDELERPGPGRRGRRAQRAGPDEERPASALDPGHQRAGAGQPDPGAERRARRHHHHRRARARRPMTDARPERRHHVHSLLMRESLLDKDVASSTEAPVVRMLPGLPRRQDRRPVDHRRRAHGLFPLVEALARALPDAPADPRHRRRRAQPARLFDRSSISACPPACWPNSPWPTPWATPTCLGTLLAPYGVVAIPPEIFGHLLPFFMQAAPGVIFNGDPPYSLWEHPPGIGRIPPHRTRRRHLPAGRVLRLRDLHAGQGRRRPLRTRSPAGPGRPASSRRSPSPSCGRGSSPRSPSTRCCSTSWTGRAWCGRSRS